ncbi:MAG: 5'-3' exonuclease H3TH domain-containing protein [Chromatiales bacterium]|nr:5'-3' exonuclease H3TH domain-containing protein [Chromatiales bacterium]
MSIAATNHTADTQAAPRRTVLVDSSIYVFRAWCTLPATLVDAEGEPCNAVLGFSDFVFRLLTQLQPERIVFAFDDSLLSSHRRDLYPDYKANRPPAPESLKRQFRLCRAFVRALGMSEFASRHFEADDVIGTLALRERQAGRGVLLVTGDKDLTQLVGPGDLWWEPQRDRMLDTKGVERTLGVRPDQVADQLALAGDRADNIPGVPGIGMATAARLLRRFDTLDRLLSDLPALGQAKLRGAKRLMALIEEHRDTVLLARRLTGIHCDADVPADLPTLPTGIDDAALLESMAQLNFSPERRQRWEHAVLNGPYAADST